MDNDDLGNDLPRLDGGFLVDDDSYVVHSDDVMLDQEENNSDSNCGGKHTQLRERDRFLPIANIAKIMKRAIPENGKIAKDARECVQECISEFISFITSEASDRCQVEKRKTINGEDVLYALSNLGFDNYVEPLKLYLKKYREIIVSPVTINKVNNRAIVVYEGEMNNEQAENDQESQSGETTAVIYSFPHKTITLGDYIDE